jgi:LasA protease
MIAIGLKFRWYPLLILIALVFAACQSGKLPDPVSLPEITPTELTRNLEAGSSQAQDEPSPTIEAAVEMEEAAELPEIRSKQDVSEQPGLPGFFYQAQSGDTLQAVARRFNLHPQEIITSQPVRPDKLLKPGEILILPPKHERTSGRPWLIPDSEVVYGPSAKDFSIEDFIYQSGGALSRHQEWLESTGWNTAAQIIERVALENSINPRLLVSILEWECGCVMGESTEYLESGYVLGVEDFRRKSLYGQLSWAGRTLAEGYYGWRVGAVIPASGSGLDFKSEEISAILPPDSNAGSAALVFYFNRLLNARSSGSRAINQSDWQRGLDIHEGFAALHSRLFGDPWQRDREAGVLLPAELTQPLLFLPFVPGWIWSFTSGPHPAWENSGALSALDFAPATAKSGCETSPTLVLSVADGVVVRSENGVVIQDLDNPDGSRADGYEGSGWVIVYLHISKEGRVQAGTSLRAGDPLGHPSCEGGPATGTHLHIARKYNGEWIAADGPVPFVMEGWTAHNGALPYEGSLTKGDQVVTANLYGPRTSWIQRAAENEAAP